MKEIIKTNFWTFEISNFENPEFVKNNYDEIVAELSTKVDKWFANWILKIDSAILNFKDIKDEHKS